MPVFLPTNWFSEHRSQRIAALKLTENTGTGTCNTKSFLHPIVLFASLFFFGSAFPAIVFKVGHFFYSFTNSVTHRSRSETRYLLEICGQSRSSSAYPVNEYDQTEMSGARSTEVVLSKSETTTPD